MEMKRVGVLANHVGARRLTNGPEKGIVRGAEKSLRELVSAEEWRARCDLAAAYRILALRGWDDSINNHLTVRVPGTDNHYLINNFGEGFEEVTASSLVKIDTEGNVILAGSRGARVNQAGFVIHSALHDCEQVGDAHAVMHTHESNVAAVSCDKRGLMPLTQTALLCGPISYHDFEGVALNVQERDRLRNDIKPKSQVMLLRNHGVLVWGKSIAQAFTVLYYVTKASEIQVKMLASGENNTNVVEDEVVRFVHNEQAFGPERDFSLYAEATFALEKRRLVASGFGNYAV